MNAQRKQYEEEGRFLEAEEVYRQLLTGRAELRHRQRLALGEKQGREHEDLETNFQDEFQAFNEEWDQKLEEYRQHCLNLEQEMKEKHQEETEKTLKNLEETIPVIPKHSSEYLNLKKIQDTLARKKEYKEAHAVQQKMLQLEEMEKLNWGRDRAAKINMQMTTLAKRLENELNSFKQKALNGLEELKKKRGIEMECFIKKFQNVKKELEVSHKVEQNKFEGRHTTGSGIFKTDANIASKLVYSPTKSMNKAKEEPAEIS